MESAVAGRGYAEPSTMGRTARKAGRVPSDNDPWVVRIAIITLAAIAFLAAYRVDALTVKDMGLLALGAIAGLATKTSAAKP
jgi:hypothetical protein